ncbi:hypothetical protein THAOC_13818, partial [Thalassiosira oceanica]
VFSNSVGTSESRAALSWSGVERRSVSRAAVTSGGKSIEPTADDIASATDRSVDGGGGGGGGGTRAFSLVLVVLVTVFLLNLGENPLADDRSSAPQAAISNLMVPHLNILGGRMVEWQKYDNASVRYRFAAVSPCRAPCRLAAPRGLFFIGSSSNRLKKSKFALAYGSHGAADTSSRLLGGANSREDDNCLRSSNLFPYCPIAKCGLGLQGRGRGGHPDTGAEVNGERHSRGGPLGDKGDRVLGRRPPGSFAVKYEWSEEADVEPEAGLATMLIGVVLVSLMGMLGGCASGESDDDEKLHLASQRAYNSGTELAGGYAKSL